MSELDLLKCLNSSVLSDGTKSEIVKYIGGLYEGVLSHLE